MKRALVLVLDFFGIGNAPDAAAFGAKPTVASRTV